MNAQAAANKSPNRRQRGEDAMSCREMGGGSRSFNGLPRRTLIVRGTGGTKMGTQLHSWPQRARSSARASSHDKSGLRGEEDKLDNMQLQM